MTDKQLARVFHYDLYGKREEKYEFLVKKSINETQWLQIDLTNDNFFFIERDLSLKSQYNEFFSISELFISYSAGIQSKRDLLFYDYDKIKLGARIEELLSGNYRNDFRKYYKIRDSSSYNLTKYLKEVNYDSSFLTLTHYRPFDDMNLYYDPDLIGRSFYKVMKQLLNQKNHCLIVSKQCINDFKFAFIGNKITDMNLIANAGAFGAGFTFPLYEYYDDNSILHNSFNLPRRPNLNSIIIKIIETISTLSFTPEKEHTPGTFAPIDILDYIYAILHSPTYRSKYKEFLKIDFPRIPYPKDQETFWQFVKLGGELRQIHLLESPVVERFITSYPVSGTNEVGKVRYEDGKAWINESQYFDHVPQVAWEFYIGGYQPAQKWLKDRKSRQLSFEDVRHYQMIIVALTETDRIMKEIDEVEFE